MPGPALQYKYYKLQASKCFFYRILQAKMFKDEKNKSLKERQALKQNSCYIGRALRIICCGRFETMHMHTRILWTHMRYQPFFYAYICRLIQIISTYPTVFGTNTYMRPFQIPHIRGNSSHEFLSEDTLRIIHFASVKFRGSRTLTVGAGHF